MIGNDTVEIVKRTPTGDYGALGLPVITESTVTVTGCSLQIRTATENNGITNTVAVEAKLFMPVTADTTAISSRDAIRYDGKDYELQGPSLTARDLNGVDDHVLCLLKWQAG